MPSSNSPVASAEPPQQRRLTKVLLAGFLVLLAITLAKNSTADPQMVEESLQALGFVIPVPQSPTQRGAVGEILEGTPDFVAQAAEALREERQALADTDIENPVERSVSGDKAINVAERSVEKADITSGSDSEDTGPGSVKLEKKILKSVDGNGKGSEDIAYIKEEAKGSGEKHEVDALEHFRYPIRGVKRFGLDEEYFEAKQRPYFGRKQARLSHFFHKAMVRREATHIVVLGGSNSQGMGVGITTLERRTLYNTTYTQLLEAWLNEYYHPKEGKHIVHNFGQGAVGSCYFDLLLEQLITPGYIGGAPDLFILETSVNDLEEQDTTCFLSLVKHIDRHFPGVSQLSVHLVSGKDFIRSCKFRPVTFYYCKRDSAKLPFVTKWHQQCLVQWCRKRGIVEDLELLQLDLSWMLKYTCDRRFPLHHSLGVHKMMFYIFTRKWAERYDKAYREGRAEILEFIQRSTKDNVYADAPLISLNTFNNPNVVWASDEPNNPPKTPAKNYYQRFVEVNAKIKSKIQTAEAAPGLVGDLHLYAPDTLHLGRWGHLLLTAEFAVLFQHLNTTAPPPLPSLDSSSKQSKVNVEKTVYAALTLSPRFYDGPMRRKLNKHRALPGARMEMNDLYASGMHTGWKLRDETSKGKPGYITLSDEPATVMFLLPPYNVPLNDTFTFKIGFLKSYDPSMADFNVTLRDRVTKKSVSKVLSGRYESKVSIFVDEVVGTFHGSNRVSVSVQSLPRGEAKKVKIIGLYVTRTEITSQTPS